jgi:hypothetical protein
MIWKVPTRRGAFRTRTRFVPQQIDFPWQLHSARTQGEGAVAVAMAVVMVTEEISQVDRTSMNS